MLKHLLLPMIGSFVIVSLCGCAPDIIVGPPVTINTSKKACTYQLHVVAGTSAACTEQAGLVLCGQLCSKLTDCPSGGLRTVRIGTLDCLFEVSLTDCAACTGRKI